MNELDVLLGEMEEGLLFIDLQGKIARTNAASEILLGLERAQGVGCSIHSVFEDTFFGFSMKEVLREEYSPPPQELTIKTSLGIERHLSMNPIYIQGKGLLILFRDITEWRHLQEAAKRAREFHLVHHTISHVAHALKNPLSGLKGFTSLLERGLKKTGGESFLLSKKVMEGVHTVEATIHSLLDFTKGEALKKEKVRLRPLLVSIQDELPFHLDGGIGETEADPLLLRVAFCNLIRNGLEASPTGEKVKVTVQENPLALEIVDQGCGIPDDLLRKLMMDPLTTKKEGHGLGLIEAKEIIEAHGGKLSILSSVGQGTTITLTLPQARTYAV